MGDARRAGRNETISPTLPIVISTTARVETSLGMKPARWLCR